MSSAAGPLRPLAAAGVVLLSLPLLGLLLAAPWAELPSRLGDPDVVGALVLSVVTATVATALVALVGVPLGFVLAREPSWGWVRPLALVPLVLPPVVGGVALQLAYSPRGLLGGALEALGVVIPFTTAAVVLAQVFVALPFCVLAVESGVRGVDPRMEELARVHGIVGTRLLRRVTLPLAWPGIRAGLAVAWARALGEFGATITFAGNLPGRTRTMPLAVFLELQTDPPSAVLLSMVLLAISLAILVALRGRLGVTT